MTARVPWRASGVALVAALLLIWAWSGKDLWGEAPLEMPCAPLQRNLTPPLAQAAQNVPGWLNGYQLAAENRRLEQALGRLEASEARSRALERENRRLTELLDLRQTRFPTGLAARVAGRDPMGWFAEIIVDRGRLDGVTTRMVAIAPEGLVGRVVEVNPHTARVRLVLASQTAVPVMLSGSGAVGVLYGSGGYTCQLKFVSHDVNVKEGEDVLTSGLGDVYPGGLRAGKVIRNYGRTEALFQSLEVRPVVDFGRLLEVLLVERREP